jgi:biotin carboxylase
MPRVLVLATTTGYQTRAFEEAAERLGIELAYATDRCDVLADPWRDAAVPIRFHDEEASAAAILSSARTRSIDGVIAVGDRPTVIAALVREGLGLPGHPAGGAAVSRNKQLTREQLGRVGLPVPWFLAVPRTTDPRALLASVRFPCVVKPAGLSGSRGVIRADDADGFVAAFSRVRALLEGADVRVERSDTHDVVLAEGFIEGREFAVEGLMNEGVLHTLAIFDKPDPLDGPFFEETIYVTPSRTSPGLQSAVSRAAEAAARAIGLRHGPVHAECRVNPQGIYVLEVAGRPIGGLCARALRFVRRGASESDPPISFEELLLRHTLGQASTGWTREPAASGVMMIPIPGRGVLRNVSGIERARQVQCIEALHITARTDHTLGPLPVGASYLGFIFARSRRADHVESAL